MPEPVTILPVDSRSLLKEFIDLPWEIYARDDCWVPPLKSEIRKLLTPGKHPVWNQCERSLFLAKRGSKFVGRIAAIVDHNYNRFHNERMGIWGFFECFNDPEAAKALFNEAEDWARKRGLEFIRGPMSPSTNYEVGMLLEGYEEPPRLMMTYNPPYYHDLAQGAGFTKEKDTLAFVLYADSKAAQRVERLAKRIARNGKAKVRPVSLKNLKADVESIIDIYHEAWSHNWGFVPITDGEAALLVKDLKLIGDPELVFFVDYGGEPAAVCMIMPDINPILRRLNGKIGLLGPIKFLMHRKEIKDLRLMLFGIRHEFQQFGLPLMAFDYCNQVIRRKGYQSLEMSWTLEDNEGVNQLAREVGGSVYKKYRIYGKSLEDRAN